MYRPTKSDIACGLGVALVDAIENPQPELQGYDVPVLAEAFINAVIAAAKSKDRPALREIMADEKHRAVILAKWCAHLKRKWAVMEAVDPVRCHVIKERCKAIATAA